MSLETVVEDIRDEARTRADEIRAEADDRAAEIVEAAEADADEIVAAKEREIENQIEQERDQRLSGAKLEAKQKRLSARRDVIQDVRDAVEERLSELGGDEREELTRELLDAAATEFEDEESVRVYSCPSDEELVTGILDDYENSEYAGEYDCLGGVVVEGDASRVRVNNTFDSILETVWDDQLKDISSKLFDDQ